MPIAPPGPVSAYFAAENGNDAESLARCFVDHAVVKDEGRSIRGPAAIKQWSIEGKKKYGHAVEPLEALERAGKTVVIGRVSGNFPGSPVDMEHIFGLEGDMISSLEIR
jgi:hypothetical protein